MADKEKLSRRQHRHCMRRSKRIKNMLTSFAVDPHYVTNMSSVFGTGRSVNLMRYLFMSEPFIEKHAISTQLSNVNREKHRRKSHRVCRSDREPSRIPTGSLKRLSNYNKSRKVRKFVYARILPCIPMSSTLYCYVNAKKLLNKKTFKFNCRERIRQCI